MHERAGLLVDSKQVEEMFHLGGHEWLEEDADDAERFGAKQDDTVEVGVGFVGILSVDEVPWVLRLHVDVCLVGGSALWVLGGEGRRKVHVTKCHRRGGGGKTFLTTFMILSRAEPRSSWFSTLSNTIDGNS